MVLETHSDEEGRLAAVRRHDLSDADTRESLRAILSVARTAMDAPMAALSIIERTHQHPLVVQDAPDGPVERGHALGALAIETGEPLVVEDLHADPRTAERATAAAAEGGGGTRAYMGVPLVCADGYRIGVLEIMDTKIRRFTAKQIAMGAELANLAMAVLADGQTVERDALTGAMTRRRFQAEIEREFSRACRYERPASLVFLDVDAFRDINAALGLRTADEVLRTIANRAMETLRATDLFGRIGGEAFGILLPETLAYEASQCAERIREEISRLRFRNPDRVFSVTAGFGIAPLNPHIKTAAHWFAQADIALYGAKRSGSNCVVFADDTQEPAPSAADTSSATFLDRLH